MKKYFFIILLFLLPNISHASLKITEIMYDVSGTDSGREWIEIKNTGSEIDLVDVKLLENSVNHKISPHIEEQTLVILDGEYAIIADNPAKFILDYPAYSGKLFDSAFSLNNTGEGISLILGEETLDSVFYTPDLGATGDGHSLQLNGSIFTAAKPTPGAENTTEQLPTEDPDDSSNTDNSGNNSSDDTTTGSGSSGSNASTHSGQIGLTTYEPKSLKIGTGRKRYTTINTPIEFNLFTSQTNEINPRDVTWSFGDGESKRGSRAIHTYLFPGTYNVVANVETERDKAVSRTRVIVTEPMIEISVDNGQQSMNIKNLSDKELNIGEYRIALHGSTKSLSPDTIIDPLSSLILPLRRYTDIDYLLEAKLYYPNGDIVAIWFDDQVSYMSSDIQRFCRESGYCNKEKLDDLMRVL